MVKIKKLVEEWKDIPEYEGYYQISNLGRVKSVPRIIKNNGGYYISKEKILKVNSRDGKYMNITLSKKNSFKMFRIHTLVAMAFLNYKPFKGSKLVVDHINNDGKDNNVDNLQIISQRINCFKDKKNSSSRYIGVTFKKSIQKWCAFITINQRDVYLGGFIEEIDAARQYEKAVSNLASFINPKQFRKFLCELP